MPAPAATPPAKPNIATACFRSAKKCGAAGDPRHHHGRAGDAQERASADGARTRARRVSEWSVEGSGRAVSRNRSAGRARGRSEEHTSELQSLMRNSYDVFCLTKKKRSRSTKPTKKHI